MKTSVHLYQTHNTGNTLSLWYSPFKMTRSPILKRYSHKVTTFLFEFIAVIWLYICISGFCSAWPRSSEGVNRFTVKNAKNKFLENYSFCSFYERSSVIWRRFNYVIKARGLSPARHWESQQIVGVISKPPPNRHMVPIRPVEPRRGYSEAFRKASTSWINKNTRLPNTLGFIPRSAIAELSRYLQIADGIYFFKSPVWMIHINIIILTRIRADKGPAGGPGAQRRLRGVGLSDAALLFQWVSEGTILIIFVCTDLNLQHDRELLQSTFATCQMDIHFLHLVQSYFQTCTGLFLTMEVHVWPSGTPPPQLLQKPPDLLV